jgi:hypothetical protein
MKTKHKVEVIWNFAPKPPAIPMVKLWNGQQIARGVAHDLRPQGAPTEKIWCIGCGEYFLSWHLALWRHGMCKDSPEVSQVTIRPTKNDNVPMPLGFDLWSTGEMKSWLWQHRPENYVKIYGGK